MSEKKNKIYPFGDETLTDEEREDCAVIEVLVATYGLGFSYGKKSFSFFGPPNVVTNVMNISESLAWLRSFETRYANEVWFQYGNYAGRRAAVEKRMQSSEGGQ